MTSAVLEVDNNVSVEYVPSIFRAELPLGCDAVHKLFSENHAASVFRIEDGGIRFLRIVVN